MANCERCGRGPQFGYSVSHSNVHTKRRWRPNIQRKVILENGVPRRIYICTNCLKTLRKAG